MARAKCQNTDCRRYDEWWQLRKHPDDYARGVTCPDCGTTNVEVEHDEQEPRAPTPRDGGELEGHGEDIGESFIRAVDTDLSTGERLRGLRGLVSAGLDLADWYNQYRERKMEEQELRAQRIELGDPKTLPFPECDECGYQFDESDIPLNAIRVRCPECTTLYPVIDQGTA